MTQEEEEEEEDEEEEEEEEETPFSCWKMQNKNDVSRWGRKEFYLFFFYWLCLPSFTRLDSGLERVDVYFF